MEWDDLEPIVKVVPRAQAAIYVNKDGKPRIRLSLSESFLKEIGSPERADVQAGSADGVAKLRLVFKKTGKFGIKAMGPGGARVANIPAKSPVPDGAREIEACEVESKSSSEAIIVLPLSAWASQVAPTQPVQRPPRTTHTAGSTPAAKAPLSVVEYLTSKGHKVSREKDGFLIDKVLETKAGALMYVNRYRRAAELEPLGMTEIE